MLLYVAYGAIGLGAVAAAVYPFLWGKAPDRVGRRRGDPDIGDLEELLAEKATLYATIKELEFDHQAGKLSTADYEQLRHSYEGKAVQLLQRIDTLQQAHPQTQPPRPTGRAVASVAQRATVSAEREQAQRFALRPPLVVAGVLFTLGCGLLIGYLLARPGGQQEGARVIDSPTVTPPGATDQAVAALEQRLSRDPKDLQALLALAHLFLDRQQFSRAIELYKKALEVEPRNAEAITHLGIILIQGGHLDEGLKAFDRALTINPNYLHALWNKGIALAEGRGDLAAAIPVWERFVTLAQPGPDRDRAKGWLEQGRSKLGQKGNSPKP